MIEWLKWTIAVAAGAIAIPLVAGEIAFRFFFRKDPDDIDCSESKFIRPQLDDPIEDREFFEKEGPEPE